MRERASGTTSRTAHPVEAIRPRSQGRSPSVGRRLPPPSEPGLTFPTILCPKPSETSDLARMKKYEFLRDSVSLVVSRSGSATETVAVTGHAERTPHRDVPGTQLCRNDPPAPRRAAHNYATWHSTGRALITGCSGSERGRCPCDAGTPGASQKAGLGTSRRPLEPIWNGYVGVGVDVGVGVGVEVHVGVGVGAAHVGVGVGEGDHVETGVGVGVGGGVGVAGYWSPHPSSSGLNSASNDATHRNIPPM